MAWAAIVSMVSKAAAANYAAASGVGSYIASRRDAKIAEQIGRINAAETRRAGSRVIGAQHAAYAKAGIRSDVGSPAEVIHQTYADIELAALRDVYAGILAKKQIKAQGRSLLSQGLGTFLAAGSQVMGTAYQTWGQRGNQDPFAYSRAGSSGGGNIPSGGGNTPSGGFSSGGMSGAVT